LQASEFPETREQLGVVDDPRHFVLPAEFVPTFDPTSQ
jgi:hypothetical protein